MNAYPSPKDVDVSHLLDITLKLATNDAAPIVDMPPLNIIINALGAAVDGNGDADVTLAALTGALAWIARRHWPEVSSAIRALNGERMQ